MKRKVVRHGPSTLTISLPSKYAKDNNISEGNDLEVTQIGSNLLIGREKELHRKAHINFTLKDKKLELLFNGDTKKTYQLKQSITKRTVRILVGTAYRLGYDQLDLTFDDPKVIDIVQEQIREVLIGFEIIDQGIDHCSISHIAMEDDTNLPSFTERLYQIIISMIRMIHENLSNNTPIVAQARDLELMSNKIENFCERVINKRGYVFEDSLKTITFCKSLEVIGDILRDMSISLEDLPQKKIDNNLLGLLKQTEKLLEGYYVLYNGFDVDLAIELDKKRIELSEVLINIIRKGNDNEAVIAHYIHSVIYELYRLIDVFYQEVT